ncbi:hydrogenase large subunit [Alistipes sp. An66]|uniref:hydrogenase large subunit n=1 Tax=Alistipes sp. An66 TaxID=1965650 RepID=UPI000B3AF6F3|nr:NADH-quinone oxidoreductase subunit C [Alistipes sp. An66]OUN60256.1 NADH dehydrogenase subunit [Alistipes sp. An66]
MNYLVTDNTAGSIRLEEIPEIAYADFYDLLNGWLADERCHVAHYFALPSGNRMRFYCLVLDDAEGRVLITSHATGYYDETALPSLTARYPQLHPFEREIAERWGIRFDGQPWPKPLRFPFDRYDRQSSIDNYPFYTMAGKSLHEVNVGPIHAGIIEPGAFRFICNGEQVLHLEIALGYQHRGVEAAFTATENRLRQMCLAESIAGDSAVAHATAFAEAIEKLTGRERPAQLDRERVVALELERMAMQIADTGALSMDTGYQLGQVACEALRTMTINTTQAWCGNRFGKGLIRPHGTDHALTPEKSAMIRRNVAEIARRYDEVRRDIESSPSLLARFEQCGVVPRDEMRRIGGVGQAARASGLGRDIRATHPWGSFGKCLSHESIVEEAGDVMARLTVRSREVAQSARYIDRLLSIYEQKYGATENPCGRPDYTSQLAPSSLAFGLVEGWRGETCHVAVTDAEGRLAAYRIKDPSLHNWLALALAVRGEGISDFPICNKSFNLSYCGHDL